MLIANNSNNNNNNSSSNNINSNNYYTNRNRKYHLNYSSSKNNSHQHNHHSSYNNNYCNQSNSVRVATGDELVECMETTVLENTQIYMYAHKKTETAETSAVNTTRMAPGFYNGNNDIQPQLRIKRKRQSVAVGRERAVGNARNGSNSTIRQLIKTSSPSRHHHQLQHCRKQDL
ncbi:homeobox protein 2-like [Rhagoletis pomonella]|uniref:homeobox protein 2-like n=1 Tax=Rhagoletis pomonella TaxID=28610 RepID=UPI00177D8134|nr:homeobox protein 2-like [Rhagoletis pomonella]